MRGEVKRLCWTKNVGDEAAGQEGKRAMRLYQIIVKLRPANTEE